MKKVQWPSLVACLLVLGAAPLQAHTVFEAVQHGGSVPLATWALVHPVLEDPAWSLVAGVWLLAVISLYRLARRITRRVASTA